MPVRICVVIACRMAVSTSVILGHHVYKAMDSLSSDRQHFPTTHAVAYGAQAVVLRITSSN